VIEGAFWWWLFGSLPAFALVIAFLTVDRSTRVSARSTGKRGKERSSK
jgi:hypothetical protein